jgi:hypothetical protein
MRPKLNLDQTLNRCSRATVYAAVGSEEDAAVPPGSFVSTMAAPGAIAVKPDQATAISAQPAKTVRLARAVAK